MKNEYIRLIKNLLVLGVLILLGVLIYWFFSSTENKELTIEDTPIHIESIKTIAEISTISYKDEVVIDSVEFYDKGISLRLYDPEEWMRIFNRNIKRRLTIIVKGEIKYGIDLTDKNFKLLHRPDTLIVQLPSPKILDIIMSPSKTEIFQEQGTWRDYERRILESKAKAEMKINAEELSLRKKAEENTIRLLEKLIQTPDKLIIEFQQ